MATLNRAFKATNSRRRRAVPAILVRWQRIFKHVMMIVHIKGELFRHGRFGSVAKSDGRSDRLGPSCNGTGQRCLKGDISNPRSSFCAFVVIFDMR